MEITYRYDQLPPKTINSLSRVGLITVTKPGIILVDELLKFLKKNKWVIEHLCSQVRNIGPKRALEIRNILAENHLWELDTNLDTDNKSVVESGEIDSEDTIVCCENCVFSDVLKDASGMMMCRRYAPRPKVREGDGQDYDVFIVYFPVFYRGEGNWCGEFKLPSSFNKSIR